MAAPLEQDLALSSESSGSTLPALTPQSSNDDVRYIPPNRRAGYPLPAETYPVVAPSRNSNSTKELHDKNSAKQLRKVQSEKGLKRRKQVKNLRQKVSSDQVAQTITEEERVKQADEMSAQPTTHRPQGSGGPPPPAPQSGLVQAVFSNGREKGSAATPVPAKSQPLPSPTPNRSIQTQLDKMSRSMSQGHNGFPPKDNRPPVSYAHTRGSNSSSTHVSNLSFGSAGQLSSAQDAFGSLSITDDVTLPQLKQLVYEHITATQRSIQNNPGISPQIQSRILEQFRIFGHDFTEKSRSVQRKIDKDDNASVNLKTEMEDMVRRLASLTTERDQVIQEKTIILAQLEQANKQIEEGYSHEQTLRNTNQALMKQLANMESRVSHRGPRVNIADPFTSPVASHKKSLSSSSAFGDKTPRAKSPSPSKLSGPSPYSGIPTGPAVVRNRRRNGGTNNSFIPSTKTITATPTEYGDIPTGPNYPESQAMALVHLHITPESEDFSGEFGVFYGITEGYVNSYCSKPNPETDKEIPPKKQELWEYMMSIAYPGHTQDSHTHVMLLISQEDSRKYFVMRLILSYCFQKILVIDTWFGFSVETDNAIKEVKEAMKVRGLANEERQALVDRLVKAVHTIMASPHFEFWKSVTMQAHCKKLRDYVGMLLNEGAIRQDAGRDLGVVAMRAWDIGVKMHTSRLSFQVIFPETAGKFAAATMIAKDRPDADPMQLQLTQTRLKLIITPVITLRDDRERSIKVRNLHHSTVLTMS